LRLAGKGGWTAERKYELDSGAYFINLLHNYMHTPGLYDPERLLLEPVMRDAVLLMLKVRFTLSSCVLQWFMTHTRLPLGEEALQFSSR
jgi:hypothetical protein